MKKFISFAAMMLLCVLTLSAQNYKGSWISQQSFEGNGYEGAAHYEDF